MEHSCNTQHSVNTLAHNSTLLLLFSITIAMYEGNIETNMSVYSHVRKLLGGKPFFALCVLEQSNSVSWKAVSQNTIMSYEANQLHDSNAFDNPLAG